MTAMNACARLVAKNDQPVVLEAMQATGKVDGVLLDMTVEQRFRNPGKDNLEVLYTFPLPWGAVLLGIDVQLGKRHLTGNVIEKILAETRYEEAIADGDAAIMLEKNSDDSYSLSLGNLGSGERCMIRLRYAQLLRYEQGGIRLLIPTVLAPRFGDPVRDGGLQSHQVPVHDVLADYPFDLELQLLGALAQARITSPTHAVSVMQDGGSLTVSLARRGALDRDFVLVADQLAHPSQALLATDAIYAGHHVALASFYPQLAAASPTSVAVKILVDCSGSMAGDSIDAARRALKEIAAQFNEGDTFCLSRFGSTVEQQAATLRPVTPATHAAACDWIARLDADMGGTEMATALHATFAIAADRASDVLLITDGAIHAIDATVDLARASGQRVFVVGIGSAVAETALRRLADATGGASDFVAPDESVEPAVLRMFARLRSPQVSALAVKWPGGTPPVWVAPVPASAFDGDTVHAVALFREKPAGLVRLVGATEDVTLQEIASVVLPVEAQDNPAIARMAAAIRVQACENQGTEAALTALAIEYQLVTATTSFLLVDQRAEQDKTVDLPALHQVKQMMPAGLHGFGSVRQMAAIHSGYLRAPAVWRRESASTSMHLAERRAEPSYDIPPFLRKTSNDRPSGLSGPSQAAGASDVTPLALSIWLAGASASDWPTTFAALFVAGAGINVIGWLREQESADHDETRIVAAFVAVMSDPMMRQLLDLGGTSPHAQGLLFRGWLAVLARIAGAATNPDLLLQRRMRLALKNVTATQWPMAVCPASHQAI